jgi:hypothetical protein
MKLLKKIWDNYKVPMILSLLFNIILGYHYEEIPTFWFIVSISVVNAIWVAIIIHYFILKRE